MPFGNTIGFWGDHLKILTVKDRLQQLSETAET